MAKKFKVPFAFTGDKTTVPVALQPDGSVSYTQGFGPDYELDKLVDPINAKDVPRDQTNQLFHDVTEAVGEVQLYGAALWSADMAPYPINALVRHNDLVWRNTIAGNSAEPGTDATWVDETTPATDYLNTQRIDVASASTVDLTALAPNTRHINITGTAAMTGFTVAAGQCYFVRFAGALTLTNGAGLVTNRGANITTAAGDTCIIRATAENTVEVLCGDFLSEVAVGTRGQTWQNVTASRVAGTTYTNTTGRPILVVVSATLEGQNFGMSVDGIYIAEFAPYNVSAITIVVPPGSIYFCGSGAELTLSRWSELR